MIDLSIAGMYTQSRQHMHVPPRLRECLEVHRFDQLDGLRQVIDGTLRKTQQGETSWLLGGGSKEQAPRGQAQVSSTRTL